MKRIVLFGMLLLWWSGFGWALPGSRYRIAVFDFTDLTPGEHLGPAVAESMVEALMRTRGITPLERLQVKNIQREIDFGRSGMVDRSTMHRLHRVLDADLCLIGDVEVQRGVFTLRARLINLRRRERVFSLKKEGSGLFNLEDHLVRALARYCNLYVDAVPRDTGSMEAYRRYGRGLYFSEQGMLEKAREELLSALRIDKAYKKAGTLLQVVETRLLAEKKKQLNAIGSWYLVPFIGEITRLLNPTKGYKQVSSTSFFFATLTGSLSWLFLKHTGDRYDDAGEEKSQRNLNLVWGIGTGLFCAYFLHNMIRAKKLEKDIEQLLHGESRFSPYISGGGGLFLSASRLTAGQREFFGELEETYGGGEQILTSNVGFSATYIINSRNTWAWGIDVSGIDLGPVPGVDGEPLKYSFSTSWMYIRKTYSLMPMKRDSFAPYVGCSLGISLNSLEMSRTDRQESETAKTVINEKKKAGLFGSLFAGLRFFLSNDVCFDVFGEYMLNRFNNVGKLFAPLEGSRDLGGLTVGFRVSLILGGG